MLKEVHVDHLLPGLRAGFCKFSHECIPYLISTAATNTLNTLATCNSFGYMLTVTARINIKHNDSFRNGIRPRSRSKMLPEQKGHCFDRLA